MVSVQKWIASLRVQLPSVQLNMKMHPQYHTKHLPQLLKAVNQVVMYQASADNIHQIPARFSDVPQAHSLLGIGGCKESWLSRVVHHCMHRRCVAGKLEGI